ncbi:hypothetical protein MRX96_001389 [Rhipicephalus microplus]
MRERLIESASIYTLCWTTSFEIVQKRVGNGKWEEDVLCEEKEVRLVGFEKQASPGCTEQHAGLNGSGVINTHRYNGFTKTGLTPFLPASLTVNAGWELASRPAYAGYGRSHPLPGKRSTPSNAHAHVRRDSAVDVIA